MLEPIGVAGQRTGALPIAGAERLQLPVEAAEAGAGALGSLRSLAAQVAAQVVPPPCS
ncbi:MAG: hypothetical protein R2749_07220 [Acidimicrobiales bacterium]